ncbi:ATP-binding cassette bilirubin transporter [Martiniozyma asiatica (nom. inval.)]|nr:ATP-binding cassette bilirubin transporter [Martiniozyma asiatica]
MSLLTNGFIFYMEFHYYKPAEAFSKDETNSLALPEPNIISRFTFSWMNSLIERAHKNNGLEQEELPAPPKVVSTAYGAPLLETNWAQQCKLKKCDRSLLFALFKTFGFATLVCIIYDMTESVVSFIQPQLLKMLIRFFGDQDENPPIIIGFSIAFAMFIVSIISTSFSNQAVIQTASTKFSSKAALMHLVYNKAMVLAPGERANRSTGDIVNHMSIDIQTVNNLVENVQTMLSAPLRFVLCIISLYGLLGNSTWIGLLTMAIMMPLNTYLVKILRSLYREQMQLKDKRTSFISEILQNIKSIKLYAWEKPMLDKLSILRDEKELKNLKNIGVLSAGINFAWTCVPFFVSCSTFAVFAMFSGIALTPEIIFPALSLFDLLSDPIFALPAVITALIQCSVSLKRLNSFLMADEVDPTIVQRYEAVKNFGDVSVEIVNSTFFWKAVLPEIKGDEESTLENLDAEALININFKAKKGQLACIVGRVASGKSTFLNSILGEMPVHANDASQEQYIKIHGSIAYCSQVPWIMNATFKENILFGHKMDNEFYQRVLEVCQLTSDLEILPDRDETLVGEKGISLSGGQKARLSLARSIYSRADVYLFDDVLSAVDAHVGQKIIDEVLGRNGILKSKTRILATNSIKILDEASRIYLLEDKRIVESGNMKSIMTKASGKLYAIITEFGRGGRDSPDDKHNDNWSIYDDYTDSDLSEEEGSPLGPNLDDVTGEALEKFSNKVQSSKSNATLERASIASFKRINNIDGIKRKTAQKAEKKEVGRVKWSVFYRYAQACSYSGIVLTLLLVFLTVATSIASNYWLMYWSEKNVKNGSNENVMFYIGIYALLGIGSGALTLIRAVIMWTHCSIKASKRIHSDMAKAVLASPLQFFETTPLGRIINRFSQDISKIDGPLPRIFSAIFSSIIKTIFTMIIICSNLPFFMIIIIILSFVYVYYQRYYMTIVRDLKRITSITRSPIFAHIQESLNGSETIRAYGQSKRFSFLNDLNIDSNQVSGFCLNSVNRWLSTRLQFIGSVIIFSTSCLALASFWTEHPISTALIGLVMSYALRVTSSLSFIVRRSVEIEADVVCCERMFEYCNLPPERDEEAIKNELITAPNGWPHQGTVRFNNYSTKYRKNLEPVLRNISLSIAAKEKIGIVGRTGAGKSSLVMSIFRIIEATEGNIEIDGINTSDLKLNELRKNLSIIPQDAQCIEGSIKYNLDPFAQYSDDQIWKAIKMSNLEDQIMNMSKDQNKENPLEVEISESGLNLSVGQRQLVCLARVLLKTQQSLNLSIPPTKILILDEATSSVDAETDKTIQQTIRSEFSELTIITIAHRLDTIMDSDKILVLDRGEVSEFDDPEKLLSDKNSAFYKLCFDGGYVKDP